MAEANSFTLLFPTASTPIGTWNSWRGPSSTCTKAARAVLQSPIDPADGGGAHSRQFHDVIVYQVLIHQFGYHPLDKSLYLTGGSQVFEETVTFLAKNVTAGQGFVLCEASPGRRTARGGRHLKPRPPLPSTGLTPSILPTAFPPVSTRAPSRPVAYRADICNDAAENAP